MANDRSKDLKERDVDTDEIGEITETELDDDG